MGVPAFFRWLSLKYPRIICECVEHVTYDPATNSEVRTDASSPNPNGVEYDNLYLDMNGIIHPCTHPEDRPAPKNEKEMFEAVFDYIDRIIGIVRPRNLLYVAIDGVAPRAKVNQQRARRFLSAQETERKKKVTEKMREEWELAGLNIPDDGNYIEDDTDGETFDSNVITPGTPFMSRISVALKKYIANRIETDKAWFNLKVIFSDASVPGEGEHKIAEFIRVQRAQKHYNPDVRHVLYGLDADLIMLGLMTHEMHFTLLREEVLLSKNGRRPDEIEVSQSMQLGVRKPSTIGSVTGSGVQLRSKVGGKKPFLFLHISTLREYLENEFKLDIEAEHRALVSQRGSAAEGFKYNLERVIDDFVFLCFFVGNDFLPRLPTFDIREGAIDYLIELYKTHLPETGYITHGAGEVNFERMRNILKHAAPKETQIFQDRAQREKAAEERRKDMQSERKRPREVLERPTPSVPTSAGEELIELGRPAKNPRLGSADHRAAATKALQKSLARVAAAKEGSPEKPRTFKESQADRSLKSNLQDGSKEKESQNQNISGVREERNMAMKDVLGKENNQVIVHGKEAHVEADSLGCAEGSVHQKAISEDSCKGEDKLEAAEQKAPDSRREPENNQGDEIRYQRNYEEELRERIRKEEAEIILSGDNVRLGDPGWKARYYQAKFHWPANNEENKKKLIMSYMEGLSWVMKYYYRGCVSWTWYYPYHYAPFASDIAQAKIESSDIKFELGEPFHPFTQLMGVMPPSSGVRVFPKCYSALMTDPSSPIIDFYPRTFKIDLNGKRFAHQGVVLLPFVDEKRLLDVISPLLSELTESERERNSFGESSVVVHTESVLGRCVDKISDNEMILVPEDAAVGLMFGSLRRKERLGTGMVISSTFYLPEKLPHQSKILATASRDEPRLDAFHKAEAGRFGWKPATFGPLGKEAKLLRMKRRERLYPRGHNRGYSASSQAIYTPRNQVRGAVAFPRTGMYQNYPYGVYQPHQYQAGYSNGITARGNLPQPTAYVRQHQGAHNPRSYVHSAYAPYTPAYHAGQVQYQTGAYQGQNHGDTPDMYRDVNQGYHQVLGEQGHPNYNYGMNFRSYSSAGSYGSGGRGLRGPAAASMRGNRNTPYRRK